MITDEMIIAVCQEHGVYVDENMSAFKAMRNLVALAHEVKPLEWRYDRKAFCFAYAYTPFGKYEIDDFDSGFMLSFGHVCIAQNMKTDADAIAAANADFKQRAMNCLVHGGDK